MNYYVANWKMKMNKNDTAEWLDKWSRYDPSHDAKVIIAPSSMHLHMLQDVPNVQACAQDISDKQRGAHTGDIGAFQIKEYASFSIIGHSERNEAKEVVQNKLQICLQNGITPIVCFTDPNEVEDYFHKDVILAWEDPENISVDGKFNQKDPHEIADTVNNMKNILPAEAKILYGGSVNNQNISDLKNIDLLDGVLVGSSSLDAGNFFEMVNS